jgi:Ca-activated chloride channel homolog
MKTKSLFLTGLLALASGLMPAFAGGTLTPIGSPHAPIQLRSHQVNVTINNGFAQTEVLQTFFNPNPTALEALYAFPVPKSASLSEVTITSGEKTLNGSPPQERSRDDLRRGKVQRQRRRPHHQERFSKLRV